MPFFDQNHLDVITGHIAWHGKINQFMSELFLYAHSPMSYILWQSSQNLHYFFSYVVDIFTIHHQMFFFDSDSFFWIYICGETTYQCKDLYETLQSIMQRNPKDDWKPIIHPSLKPLHVSNSQKIISAK